MKTRNSHAQPLEERTLSPEPESMQKYSDEVPGTDCEESL